MTRRTILKIIVGLALITILISLNTVYAEGHIVFDLTVSDSTNITEYINRFYTSAVAVSGIAAVVMIVVGAIYYVVSGGSQDKQREGKDIITSAIWGVVLLLGAYTILNTINPELVTLSPPGGDKVTKYSCGVLREVTPDIRECEAGERPIEDPSDPNAVPRCCVPGLGYDLTTISCPEGIVSTCESPTTWSSAVKIPDCRTSSVSTTAYPCNSQWSLFVWSQQNPPPTDGTGIYYRWVYYPENTVPDAINTPQNEEPQCVVYAYKKDVGDKEFIIPGLLGLKKCL